MGKIATSPSKLALIHYSGEAKMILKKRKRKTNRFLNSISRDAYRLARTGCQGIASHVSRHTRGLLRLRRFRFYPSFGRDERRYFFLPFLKTRRFFIAYFLDFECFCVNFNSRICSRFLYLCMINNFTTRTALLSSQSKLHRN